MNADEAARAGRKATQRCCLSERPSSRCTSSHEHLHAKCRMRPRAAQRGFTLVELMVTVAIALFLLGGLVTIVQNVRDTNMNQTAPRAAAGRAALCHDRDHGRGPGRRLLPRSHHASRHALLPATRRLPADGLDSCRLRHRRRRTTASLDTIATRFQTAPSFPSGPVQGPILCDGTDTSQQVPDTCRSSSRSR